MSGRRAPDTAPWGKPDDGLSRLVLKRGAEMTSSSSRSQQPGLEAAVCSQLSDLLLDPGKLRLGRQLGRGGFAAVFKAEYAGTGQLAFKALLPVQGRSGEIFTKMFIREAQAANKLQHP